MNTKAFDSKIRAKRYYYISIPVACLCFFFFSISSHVTTMIADFLKSQEIPYFTPIHWQLSTYLIIAGCSIVGYSLITIILHHFVYDAIRKKIRTAAYVCGHIFFVIPLDFITLLGVNYLLTLLFEAAPFEVWDIAYLIADTFFFALLYNLFAHFMHRMSDQQLMKQKKNHSLSIYLLTESGPVMVSDFITNQTFQICYQAMQANLSDLKPMQVFVISQYRVHKDAPKHQWFYSQEGKIFTP